MSNGLIRTIVAVIVAVCSFLLIQPEVVAIPVLAIVLGAINVGVAVIKVPEQGL